VLLGRISQAKV